MLLVLIFNNKSSLAYLIVLYKYKLIVFINILSFAIDSLFSRTSFKDYK